MLWLHNRELPIPLLTLADPALTLSYRYWSQCKCDGDLPARCHVDTPEFRLLVPDAVWLDLRAVDDAAWPVGPLAVYGGAVAASGTGEAGSRALADELRGELRHIALCGVPLFHSVHLSIRGRACAYQQLLLPTSDDGRTVSEVMSVAKPGGLAVPRRLVTA